MQTEHRETPHLMNNRVRWPLNGLASALALLGCLATLDAMP